MKRVAIVTGGEGSEQAIARQSAANVAKALEGRYEMRVYDFPTDLDRFLADRDSIDVAVPMMHGKGGEDGQIQGFFKTLGLPFIFSDVEAHAIGMNKILAKSVVAGAGVKTATSHLLKQGEQMTYEHPVVVKPMDSGSTLGVTIARSQVELDTGIATAFAESAHVFVEDFIEGDEFTVAVIESAGETIALPVIFIKPKTAFFDYTAKYVAGMAEEICPAPIPDEIATRLQAVALHAHKAIGARHVSRTDIIVDKNNTPWFLEINTIPGMSVLLPKAITSADLNFTNVLSEWIELAIRL